jgi:hypothetical protein
MLKIKQVGWRIRHNTYYHVMRYKQISLNIALLSLLHTSPGGYTKLLRRTANECGTRLTTMKSIIMWDKTNSNMMWQQREKSIYLY